MSSWQGNRGCLDRVPPRLPFVRRLPSSRGRRTDMQREVCIDRALGPGWGLVFPGDPDPASGQLPVPWGTVHFNSGQQVSWGSRRGDGEPCGGPTTLQGGSFEPGSGGQV